MPFTSPSYVGPIGYGRPKPTYDLLEETDLIVFVGTVPGDVVTDGFTIRQNWDRKNFLVTIDPSLRGRSGPRRQGQVLARARAGTCISCDGHRAGKTLADGCG